MPKVARLRPEAVEEPDFPNDVARIRLAYAEIGVIIDDITAQLAWQRYSDGLCAGWLYLPPTNDSIIAILDDYIEIQEHGDGKD